ncbi:MAG TPA: DUF4097 family beta strand repeat-containing protein [Candidatus Acidoferrales bacterium]|nr:DUF4097 family beta strand repeat-containing protein [Candidatus Acidoferrales bacterium]
MIELRSAAVLRVLLLALCACSGSFGERVHEQFHQAIDSGATPIVHVDNIAGTVALVTWAKPIVNIVATKYGYNASDLRSITISVNRAGNGIFVVTTYGDGDHGGGVRYRVSVPAGASVQIGNVAGAVSVGPVTGNVSVETQAGTIEANLGRVDGDRAIDLHATTGAITARIARESDATVDAQSTVGGFSSDVPGIEQSRENVVGVRASGKIGSGSARIRLSTTTGAIALRTIQ